jgi:hypothetical protein
MSPSIIRVAFFFEKSSLTRYLLHILHQHRSGQPLASCSPLSKFHIPSDLVVTPEPFTIPLIFQRMTPMVFHQRQRPSARGVTHVNAIQTDP